MASGIYSITNSRNGKRYIGASVNIDLRWSVHKSILGNNKHHNIHLQRAWNKYGARVFEFVVLESIENKSKKYLHAIEQWWLYHHKGEYNIADKVSTSTFGRKHSEETKLKIGKASKGRGAGENNYSSKLTEEEVIEIRRLYTTGKYFHRELSELFSVSDSSIGYIINYKTWKHI